MNTRLTERCRNLLRLLQAARWLSTGQVHRRFFASATASAARRRLRKLTRSRYLKRFQANRMQEALFALGPAGKRELERRGGTRIVLERRPPKQLEHFLTLNELRIALELAAPISYFFAYWELPGLGWKQPIIPDAVFAVGERTFKATGHGPRFTAGDLDSAHDTRLRQVG